jgi:oxygen-dependent protoporphyrinogen oxidase
VRTNCRVERLERAEPDGYRLGLWNGETLHAKTIVLATPVSSARALLEPVAPETSRWFARMKHGSSGNIVLAWPNIQIARPLAGFGMVVPKREAQPFNAITVHSRKYAGRAPEGWSLLRFFFGGYRSPDTLELDDEQLLRAACAFAERAIYATGTPIFSRTTRWWDGNPIYQVGHRETITGLEASLPTGISVAGAPFRGPGIPDVVRSSTDLADRIAASLVPAAAAYERTP